ncbi:putative protein transport protein sec31 [Iris pallida]|uniref:Uncharacterized protein n=1 Tax=Iris pallida TaxID=29817 RepID=A0AAX6EC14_IRIPA|nr:putative protein transport protein sec31 [Iris pallida]
MMNHGRSNLSAGPISFPSASPSPASAPLCRALNGRTSGHTRARSPLRPVPGALPHVSTPPPGTADHEPLFIPASPALLSPCRVTHARAIRVCRHVSTATPRQVRRSGPCLPGGRSFDLRILLQRRLSRGHLPRQSPDSPRRRAGCVTDFTFLCKRHRASPSLSRCRRTSVGPQSRLIGLV